MRVNRVKLLGCSLCRMSGVHPVGSALECRPVSHARSCCQQQLVAQTRQEHTRKFILVKHTILSGGVRPFRHFSEEECLLLESVLWPV